MRSKNTDMTGQMLVVLELMDLYPLRPESKLDFDGVVFNAFHAKAEPGEIFTIIDTSPPRWKQDDTWYKVISPSGAVAWVMACHSGVFYKAIGAKAPRKTRP